MLNEAATDSKAFLQAQTGRPPTPGLTSQTVNLLLQGTRRGVGSAGRRAAGYFAAGAQKSTRTIVEHPLLRAEQALFAGTSLASGITLQFTVRRALGTRR